MVFWKNVFQKKEKPQTTPASEVSEQTIAQQIAALLQCPIKELPQPEEPIDLEDIWDTYQEALQRGKKQGFTPVLLICDDLLLEMIEENLSDEQSHIEIPTQLNGKTFLEKRFIEYWENMLSYGANPEEMLAKAQKTPTGNHRLLSLRHTIGADTPIFLAEIPTSNPWEALAWIPFGGWNECPMPEECIAVLQYWYETYGVVPACIGHDTLELYVPHPVTDAEKAITLAKEQYAFCNDIVDQGMGSIGVLAQELQHSTVWFFWWD